MLFAGGVTVKIEEGLKDSGELILNLQQKMIEEKTFWLPSLLNKFNHEFYLSKDHNVLDLGCGIPWHIFQTHEIFEYFSFYQGIDVETEEIIKHSGLEKSQLLNHHLFQIYSDNHFKKIKSQDEFDKKINIQIKGALEFLESNSKKFDLVLMSNFLHMFNSIEVPKKIFEKTIQHLNDFGIIYLKVANKNHRYQKQKDRITFDRKSIKNLIENLTILAFIETKEHFEILCRKGDKF